MTYRGLDRLVALCIFAVSAGYFAYAWQLRIPPSSDDGPLSARSFPFALGLIAMALSAVIAVKPSGNHEPVAFERTAWVRTGALTLLMAFYTLAVTRLGFVPTASLFLAGGFAVLGERRPHVLAAVAIGVSLSFWFLFRQLDVDLDWGWFERIGA
jgi:putative tricarboxylic transport membrane protein